MTLIQEDPDLDSIQRCPHDSENPYAQILNEILRHKTLSIESIWLLSYLLSNDRSWKIKTSQILLHLKGRMGRKKTYDSIKDLIKHGYMKKIVLYKGNLRAGVRYFISEKPKFKEDNSNNSSDVPVSGMPKNGKHKNKQDSSYEESKKQQQKKVAKAPVVVSFKEQEKAEKEADEAATQYIKSELSRGNKVNETRIRQKAKKEGWKPNKEESKSDLTNGFVNGETYKGIRGCHFECLKDKKGIAFHNLNHPASQPQGFKFNSSTFVKDFEKLLEKLQIKRP